MQKFLKWLKKLLWIRRAAIELKRYDDTWVFASRLEYAEVLWEDYVRAEPADPWDPVDAVAEDATNWW